NFLTTRGLSRIAVAERSQQFSKPQRLLSLGQDLYEPTISHDGRRLAYTHFFKHANILPLAVRGNGARAGGHARSQSLRSEGPLISSSRNDSQGDFSADGGKIAFISDRTGNPEVWICQSSGMDEMQLTSFGGPEVTTPRWSPDGRWIAFDSTAQG